MSPLNLVKSERSWNVSTISLTWVANLVVAKKRTKRALFAKEAGQLGKTETKWGKEEEQRDVVESSSNAVSFLVVP